MAIETKYKSYIRVGDQWDVMKHYKMFGWKLVGQEKYEDWLGEAERSPRVHFYELCFSRDKDAPWYNSVCQLEEEYNDICKNNYEAIKNKYKYDEKVKIGKKPIEPKMPKLAEPSKFLKGTIVFIIGILIMLIGISQEGEFQNILLPIGAVIAGIGVIVLLFKIKYLSGLKGEEKKKALEKQAKYKKDKEKYEDAVEKFFASRKHQIEKELKTLLNF